LSNALSIDLEYWWNSEFLKGHLPEEREDQAIEATGPLVHLLDRYSTKATFFVLGEVAEKHPKLVRMIHDGGHEIASHGYSHRMLEDLGEKQFEEELRGSVTLLQSITGERPIGFRAPNFSMTNSTRWAFEVLARNGFEYDSSVFPIKTMLYGVPDAPLFPYRPSAGDIARPNGNGTIIEFPMTVLRVVRNIPVAGGFYLRVLPLWFLKMAIRRVNRARPAIIYLHPWETYLGTPRLGGLSFRARFVTYYGINVALGKLEGLLNEFSFKPVREVLKSFATEKGARV